MIIILYRKVYYQINLGRVVSKVIHVIPVGFKKDMLLESIRQSKHPIQKAYLVVGKDREEEIYRISEEIEKTLKVLVEVEIIHVDKLDVYTAVSEILRVIKKELTEGNKVFVNVTDSPRTLCLACVISAQLSGCRLYTAIPMYENGNEVGIAEVIEIPIPKPKRISSDKMKLVKLVYENGGVIESINKLIDLFEGISDDEKEYMSQRTKMSYNLRGLEEVGLVKMCRVGKNTKVILTNLGKAFAVMAY